MAQLLTERLQEKFSLKATSLCKVELTTTYMSVRV